VLVPQADGRGHGVDVELVQLERDALTHHPAGLRIELDVARVRDLLDEDDDLHRG
jgi:hypothetical protein